MTLLNSKNGKFFVSKEKKFYGISYRIEGRVEKAKKIGVTQI